ncbi:DMT family transporter [Vibrio sp. WJH972]
MQLLNKYSLLAVIGGGLLALMIHLNSQLASVTSALSASWIAHAVGAFVAWCLLIVFNTGISPSEVHMAKPTKIYHLGGIPGALTVILASITINSGVGLSGTLALALIGQLVFSMLCEHLGLFNLKQRTFLYRDLIPILLVTSGSFMLIFSKG